MAHRIHQGFLEPELQAPLQQATAHWFEQQLDQRRQLKGRRSGEVRPTQAHWEAPQPLD
jgi:hypothetical protein